MCAHEATDSGGGSAGSSIAASGATTRAFVCSNFAVLGASKYVEPTKIGYPEPKRADLRKDVYAASRNGATRDLPERAPQRHGRRGSLAPSSQASEHAHLMSARLRYWTRVSPTNNQKTTSLHQHDFKQSKNPLSLHHHDFNQS